MKLVTPDETLAALCQFCLEWESFYRLPITENTMAHGDTLAVEHNLRGDDATHLACALIWQETLVMPVTLASFDDQRRIFHQITVIGAQALAAELERSPHHENSSQAQNTPKVARIPAVCFTLCWTARITAQF
jgi:hypothetical protein